MHNTLNTYLQYCLFNFCLGINICFFFSSFFNLLFFSEIKEKKFFSQLLFLSFFFIGLLLKKNFCILHVWGIFLSHRLIYNFFSFKSLFSLLLIVIFSSVYCWWIENYFIVNCWKLAFCLVCSIPFLVTTFCFCWIAYFGMVCQSPAEKKCSRWFFWTILEN